MSYTLNTEHALYPYVHEIIGVKEGALVSLVTSRTFTKHADATFGTGVLGEHFSTLANGYDSKGASISPAVALNTTTSPDMTLLVIVNAATAEGQGGLVFNCATNTPTLNWNGGTANATNGTGAVTTGTIGLFDAAPHSIAVTRTGETAHALFVDGVAGGAGGRLGFNNAAATWSGIGGHDGSGSVAADFVWLVWLTKTLSAVELADLHSSLGAGNTFGLIAATGGTTPTGTVTIGTITPGSTSASVTYSYSASDQTGYEYRIDGGTAASIGASPATISGLTASTEYDLEIRAINASGDGAWSSVSTFTTDAAGPGNTAPIFDGPSIDAISGTEAVALSSLDVSSRFSDAESSLTFSAIGTWPAGVTVSSVGVISGTPTTAGTYASLQVRATDAGSLIADSNTFSITVAAPPAAGINVTEPLKNNAGTLLASLSGLRVAVLQAADLVSVHEQTGLTTDASGLLPTITDAAIVTGTSYHVAIKLADGSVGITGPITAS